MGYLAFLDPQFEPTEAEIDRNYQQKERELAMTIESLQEKRVLDALIESQQFEQKYFGDPDTYRKQGGPYRYTLEHFPYALPRFALTFASVAELKRVVTESGSFYFSPKTMKHWSGRVSGKLYGMRFFVESLADYAGDRVYRVSWVEPNAEHPIHGVGHFNQDFASLTGAKAFAARAARVVYPQEWKGETA